MKYEKIFFNVDKIEKLSQEQINEHIRKAQNGDIKSKEIIVKYYIKYIINLVLKKYYNFDIKEDLISVGFIGLIKAIDSFNFNKNVLFFTYASKCINNEICMFIRKEKFNSHNLSLNQTIQNLDGENNITIGEILVNDDFDILSHYESIEQHNIIMKILETLPNREKNIIMLYFGFKDNKKYTHKELAEMYGYDQSYISRIISKSLNQIKIKLIKEKVIERNIIKKSLKKE